MIIEAKNGFIILTAETGMVFKSKLSGDILTKRLYLGYNDSVDNYEEISEVEAYAETEIETVQTEEAGYEDGI